MTEIPTYSLTKFVTDIRGWMGLFSGTSLISVIEILLFIIFSLIVLWRKCKESATNNCFLSYFEYTIKNVVIGLSREEVFTMVNIFDTLDVSEWDYTSINQHLFQRTKEITRYSYVEALWRSVCKRRISAGYPFHSTPKILPLPLACTETMFRKEVNFK